MTAENTGQKNYLATGLTVSNGEDHEYPVYLDGAQFVIKISDDNEIRAEYFIGLQEQLNDKLKTQRFELPFTTVNGTNGTVTGFHASNGNMLVRWGVSGRNTQVRAYELSHAMPRLPDVSYDELIRLIAARDRAQADLDAFITYREFPRESYRHKGIEKAAKDAQLKAAGLPVGN